MKNNISFWSSLISLSFNDKENLGNYPTSLGKLPLVVSQLAPAILWFSPTLHVLYTRPWSETASTKVTASSTITTSSQKHLECPNDKLRENRVNVSSTHVSPTMPGPVVQPEEKRLVITYQIKDSQISVAMSLQFLHSEALLISTKKISQAHPCQKQHTYNRIPFLPSLHPSIF